MTATENDHRRRILDLLSQGKITVDDADQLLTRSAPASLESDTTASSESTGKQARALDSRDRATRPRATASRPSR